MITILIVIIFLLVAYLILTAKVTIKCKDCTSWNRISDTRGECMQIMNPIRPKCSKCNTPEYVITHEKYSCNLTM